MGIPNIFNSAAGKSMGKKLVAMGLVAGVVALVNPLVNSDEDTRKIAKDKNGITVKETSSAPLACWDQGYKKFGRSFEGVDDKGLTVEGKVCRNLWGGSEVVLAEPVKQTNSSLKP